jgi:RNA polymerase sigma-70 factor (ECF subfamily)
MSVHSSPDAGQLPSQVDLPRSIRDQGPGERTREMAAIAPVDHPGGWPPLAGENARALSEHLPELRRHARRIVGDDSDAQDLIQDTFERAVRAFGQFRPGTNLRAWLYTIMVRRSQDLFRARRHRPHSDVDPDEIATPSPTGEPESRWCAVTDRQFEDAVAQLPEKSRQIFEMHAVHHLAYQEIAVRLGIPVNTVGTRLARARERLRKSLLIALDRGKGES